MQTHGPTSVADHNGEEARSTLFHGSDVVSLLRASLGTPYHMLPPAQEEKQQTKICRLQTPRRRAC
jgi:hypothetical protein